MKIGVVLSGCGVMDGSEIHEAVLTLLALAKKGAEAVCMAPDMEQADVINHLSKQATREKRNVLVEAARIARGKILNVKNVRAHQIDGLIFPGGYGAAKNLSSFAADGTRCKVHPDVSRLVQEVHLEGKPIGAICIAPAVMAKLFEGGSVRMTIGTDKETAARINAMGQKHVDCPVEGTVVDKEKRLVTTPAYMLAQNIAEAAAGIEKLVNEVLELAKEPVKPKSKVKGEVPWETENQSS